MRAYTTVTRERGVVTIPVALREAAGVTPNTELTWVEVAPSVWLVGLAGEHPEAVAPTVAGALLAERTPFPTLLQRFVSGDVPQRAGPGAPRRRSRPMHVLTLTEEQMVALGTPAALPTRRRGHR
jgi:hypothetical protein